MGTTAAGRSVGQALEDAARQQQRPAVGCSRKLREQKDGRYLHLSGKAVLGKARGALKGCPH